MSGQLYLRPPSLKPRFFSHTNTHTHTQNPFKGLNRKMLKLQSGIGITKLLCNVKLLKSVTNLFDNFVLLTVCVPVYCFRQSTPHRRSSKWFHSKYSTIFQCLFCRHPRPVTFRNTSYMHMSHMLL